MHFLSKQNRSSKVLGPQGPWVLEGPESSRFLGSQGSWVLKSPRSLFFGMPVYSALFAEQANERTFVIFLIQTLVWIYFNSSSEIFALQVPWSSANVALLSVKFSSNFEGSWSY